MTWKIELQTFLIGRGEVVAALQRIAQWKDLFTDAARLLLALGEAEIENYTNNASGAFTNLFYTSLHPKIFNTEASPQERFPILREAIESASKERKLLALRACDRALNRRYVASLATTSPVFENNLIPWRPDTWGELFDAYRQVWYLLLSKLDELPADVQREGCAILLRNAAPLARIENLADMVFETIDTLSRKSYTSKGNILEKVIRILRYEKLTEEKRQRWEQIRQNLTGTTFHALMRRYIAMTVFEDFVDAKGKSVNTVQQKIVELSEQVINDPNLLHEEFEWLMTTEARNGFNFGYALAERDKTFSLLPQILEAQRKITIDISVSFLGGYLRVLAKQNQEQWNEVMNSFQTDTVLHTWIPALTNLSQVMNDQSALRVLSLAKRGVVEVDQFRQFVHNDVLGDLSNEMFEEWIKFLLSHPSTSAIHTALDLYCAYYVKEKERYEFTEDLTFALLTSPLLSTSSETIDRNSVSSWQWEMIGKAFVQTYPEKSLEIANTILQHFGEAGTIFDSPYAWSLLTEIIQMYPEQIWLKVARCLASGGYGGAALAGWLQHDYFEEDKDGALSIVQPEWVWQWIDEDIEQRGWFFAYLCVPKKFFRDDKKTCWARELLIRYWHRDDICRNLAANISSGSFEGKLSSHYQNQNQELSQFLRQEDDVHVKQWFNKYIFQLEDDIVNAKIQEERTDH